MNKPGRPEYDRWVQMLAGLNAGPGKDAVAWDSALLGWLDRKPGAL